MKRIAVVMLLVIALAAWGSAVIAQEPLQSGTTEGTLEDSSATYTVSAAAGQVFVISVTSPEFDTFLEVTDSDGNFVVSDDDSGVGNSSVLVFAPAEAGEYTLTVRGFAGDATGPYVLNVTEQVQSLEVGTPAAATIGDGGVHAFSFETEGGTFAIGATSGGLVDTSLALTDAQGNRLDTADDTDGVDPILRRVVLTAGTYFVLVAPYSETVSGDVEVLVETTELPVLGAEPTTFSFDQSTNSDVAIMNVEEGKLYEIKIESTAVGSLTISLESVDPDLFIYAYFSYSNGEGATYLYRAEATGEMQADISGGYSPSVDVVDFTLTVTEVAE